MPWRESAMRLGIPRIRHHRKRMLRILSQEVMIGVRRVPRRQMPPENAKQQ